LGLKVSEKCKYDLKTFSLQNFNMGINADFETVEKNAKVIGKISVQNWSFSSSVLLTWQITFSECPLFQFSTDLESAYNSAYFFIFICKKILQSF
jgi:hypothetical protein